LRQYRDLILFFEHLRIKFRIYERISSGTFKRQRQHDITAGISSRCLRQKSLNVRCECCQLAVFTSNCRVWSVIRIGLWMRENRAMMQVSFYWHISFVFFDTIKRSFFLSKIIIILRLIRRTNHSRFFFLLPNCTTPHTLN
jgi:hypothetical protein